MEFRALLGADEKGGASAASNRVRNEHELWRKHE
jgi:hypothetical protein